MPRQTLGGAGLAGERSAAYPRDGSPKFHVVTDRSLMDGAMESTEVEGVTIFIGFLLADVEEQPGHTRGARVHRRRMRGSG